MNQAVKQTEKSFYPEELFADRMEGIPKSFIREILKVAISPDIISFAGGLPNRELFPVQELKESAMKVLDSAGGDALQYSSTEGYRPLREYITSYYASKHDIHISPDDILITSGSQQGLDLLGKVLVNQNDRVVIEEPGYLGAIQALSLYRPNYVPVKLNDDGMDTEQLKVIIQNNDPKLMYVVPEFQNPSGISYSQETRQRVAELAGSKSMYIIEDNPYIDLRFEGTGSGSFYHYLPEKTILLGTFSKTCVPGFRTGWIVAKGKLMEKLIIAKQAADLHTNTFAQMLLYQYLNDFDIDKHIEKIIKAYGHQGRTMIKAIQEYFPPDIKSTKPKGGMFLWVKLPDHISAFELFEKSLKKKVAFVPGDPFYIDKRKYYSTFRLNFSCSDESTINEGITRIGESISELKTKKQK